MISRTVFGIKLEIKFLFNKCDFGKTFLLNPSLEFKTLQRKRNTYSHFIAPICVAKSPRRNT